MSLTTQVNIYPPDTTVVTVQTPPVVQLSIVEQVVQQIGGASNVNVVSGDGITVTEAPADTFTVRVNFGSAGNTVCEGNDARLSDARTPLAHTHAISDVLLLQDALDASQTTLTKTARKASPGTINKGEVVYITGSSGTHLLVELADADSESTAAPTIGIAASTITSTTDGTIMVAGYLEGLSNLPTASFANGAALWLSQTAGGWTTTPPTQPAHRVFLGWVVTNSNGAAGRAYIKVINGQELDELHDVLIGASPADNDLLAYDSATSLWKNQTAAQAGLAAASHLHIIGDVTGLQTALDAKLDDSQATSFGLSILGAANAAAGATALGLGTGDTPTFTGVAFPNGESITNAVNGRIEFNPSPTGSTAWRLYADMTSFNVGVRLGVINSDTNIANPAGSYIVFDTTAQISTDKSLSIHSNDWMQLRGTSTGLDTAQLSVLVNNAGSSGAFALVDLGSLGTANRSPTTAHIDPHLYVYSADTNEALDFVRMSHDRTDGLIEAGNGKLRLKGASVVRIEGPSGGFDLPATAGSSGQVLTTNGTNASWQTPSGGGVSKAFAIAMAVAL